MKTHPKFYLLQALLVLLVFTQTAAADPAKPAIGVIAPLSGYLASIGTAIRNGIELASIDHPEILEKVDLRFEDDQHGPKLAPAVYQRLRSGRRPKAIIAFGFFFPTVMGRDIARDQIPVVNLSFLAKPAIGNPYITRSMNHTKQYGDALADFLAAEKQLEYPVIRAEYDFFVHLLGDVEVRLRQVKPEKKLSIIAEVVPTEMDFRSIISKLKALKPERVGVFLLPDQLVTFMRQARASGVTAEIFGSDVCETAAGIEGARQLLEGCIYPDNEVSPEFRSTYQARFHNQSQLTFAGVAYDMSTLLASYLGSNPNATSAEILSALSQVRSRSGILGTFSFKDDPKFGRFFEYPVAVKTIRNGVGAVAK
jgi:ABC-type branched-subunit amino acid transport system substrate-binding protein